jgi:hypothetical protein
MIINNLGSKLRSRVSLGGQGTALIMPGVEGSIPSLSTLKKAQSLHYGNVDEAIEPNSRACMRRKTPNSTAQAEIQIHERCTEPEPPSCAPP